MLLSEERKDVMIWFVMNDVWDKKGEQGRPERRTDPHAAEIRHATLAGEENKRPRNREGKQRKRNNRHTVPDTYAL